MEAIIKAFFFPFEVIVVGYRIQLPCTSDWVPFKFSCLLFNAPIFAFITLDKTETWKEICEEQLNETERSVNQPEKGQPGWGGKDFSCMLSKKSVVCVELLYHI